MSNDSKPNYKKRWRRVGWLIGLVVVVGLVSPVVYRAYYRARCGAAMMVSSSCMRQIITFHTGEAYQSEKDFGRKPLTRVSRILSEGPLGFYEMPSGMCYSDKRGGSWDVEYRLRDRTSDYLDHPNQDGDSHPSSSPDAMESIGRFRFSLQTECYTTYSYQVIVSLSCYEHGRVLIGFADVHVDVGRSRSELRQFIEQDKAARATLNLAPLMFDIEQEIDDYRSRKGLDPLPD